MSKNKRFVLSQCKYQDCILDKKTNKKYDFSPHMHSWDIQTIADILNDVIE